MRQLSELLFERKVNSPTISSGTLTLDLATGRYFKVTLDANVTTLTFSNVPSGVDCTVDLKLVQDATGSRTFAWPASVKWANGYIPTVTATASNYDIFTLHTDDGGTTWSGFIGGQRFV